jgi:signal peptidase I
MCFVQLEFFMSQLQDTGPASGTASPWTTIWLSPRETIARIVATRPAYLVLPLAILGMIGSFYTELLSFGVAAHLQGWKLWLGLVAAAAVAGVVWLYVSAFVLKWIGRMLGGEASALQLRAVLAWSAVPNIIGFVAALAMTIAFAAYGVADTAGVRLLIVGIFGLWSFVIFLLMLGRVQHFGFWRTIALYVLNLVLPLLLAIFIRTFLYQPFSIPATSMAPTLAVGDNIFAAKFPYGYSRFSLPFSPPLFSGRIFGAEPKRGDVVVFRLPKDTGVDYVKRVVGLPGDRIQMKQGLLYINDVPVKRKQIADDVGDICGADANAKIKRWRETLPEGASYETLDCVDNGFYDNTMLYTVPAGHYFMLGDNRDNSTDSRTLSQVGYVPLENLIGRADLIYFSGANKGGGANRAGTVVR